MIFAIELASSTERALATESSRVNDAYLASNPNVTPEKSKEDLAPTV